MPRILSAVLALVLAAAAQPAPAQTDNPSKPWVKAASEARRIDQECEARYADKFGSVYLNTQIAGSIGKANCLEEAILDQIEVLFDHDSSSRKEVEELLLQIRKAHGKLYDSLHNGHRVCFNPFPCGMINFLGPSDDLADLYNEILKDMIAKRLEYDIKLPK